MRRVLVGLLLVFVCALVGAWLAWPALTSVLRQRIEDALASALLQPVRIERLSLSVVPLRLRLGGVHVGADPASPLGQLAALEVRLWLLPTLFEQRPVLSGHLQSVALDLNRLTMLQARGEKQAAASGLVSLRVRSVELEDARISFATGGAETVVSVATLSGAFDAAARHQTVNVSAAVIGVGVDRGEAHLNLTRIEIAGSADPHGLLLRTAAIDGDGVHIAMTPTASPRQYTLSAALDLTRLARFVGASLHGEAKIDGKLAGDLANPVVDAQVSVADLAVASNILGDAKGRLTRRGESVRLADVEVNGPLGQVTADATLTTAGAMPIAGRVNLQSGNLDALLRVAGVQLEMGHEVTALVGVSGTIQPLALNVSANGTAARNLSEPSPLGEQTRDAGRQLATFEASLYIDARQGTVSWDLRQPERNHVTGNLSWQSAQLTGALQAQLRDLAAFSQVLPRQVRDLGLSGQLDGTAALSGPASAPMLQANVTGTEMTVMGAAVPRLSGEFHIAGSTLTTSGARLDTAGGGAELTGAVALGLAPRNDWHLKLRGVDTDVVAGLVHAFTAAPIPVSGGEIDGDIGVRGTWAQAAIEGGIALRSVYIGEEPVDRIAVKVSADLPRWTAHLSAVHAASETLTLDGSGDAGSGEISIASTPFQLGNLRGASRRKLAGTANIRGAISGKLREPDGSLTVALSNVGVGESELGDVMIEATGRQGQWVINASAFEKALGLSATLRLAGGYPYSLVLKSKALDFGRLISASTSLHTALTAQVDLSGSATAWETPNGSVRISQLEVRRDQYEVKAQEAIRIDVIDGRFVIHPTVLVGPSSQLKFGGELALSGRVDLQALGAGDLVLLELMGKPFHSAQGQFNASVQVRRDLASGWNLSGQGHVREAVLDLGLPVAFADVNGDFLLGGSRVQIVNLDGKAGGGRFHVDGSVSPDEGPNLSWQLQDVAVSTDQGVEAQLVGKGQVQGRWNLMMVSGDVEVLNALYDRNIELKDFLPSFKKQLTPAPQTTPPTVEVRLNLHLHSSGGLHIDNNVAEVEMGANLRLAGTIHRPELTGTVEFLSGEVKFKQRTFSITAGTIDFRDHGSINPVLNISAESQISTAESDYTITVTVTGRADDPRIRPSADDPTLSETDILSLITFGQTAAQLQRQGGGINAFDAVALLPTGTVTGPLAKLLGVNRLEIETMQSQTTGAAGSVEPRLTIGKDITDRLRVTASTAFGAATERNVQLDYRLTRQLSLFGTWEGQTSEQSGAFGGGVKLRYEFRRLPFSLFPGGLEPGIRGDAR